jgi:predicted Zn-dependent protease
MLTEDEAHALTKEILALAHADETQVSVSASRTTNLRFARTSPTTSGETEDVSISVTSSYGKKSGTSTINQRDRGSLEKVVALAEDLARRAPEDPEQMPALPPQQYPAIPHAYDADTAEHGAEALADGVGLALTAARAQELVAAGFVEVAVRTSAIASSTGLFGYHRSTGSTLTETFRTPDGKGSGWGSSAATRIAELDFAGVAATAARKAIASASAKPLAPGSYPTILEPAVAADLVGLAGYALDGRSADEGRSFFSKPGGGTRIGETLFGKNITLRSDPLDPHVPGSPWAGEYLPSAPTDWVVDGKLANLAYGRFWAAKQGIAPVPQPSNLLMAGGAGTVDDLIASTERGVLITSVWYIRYLDPQTLLFTGLTRDGVFWIEDGAISHAVNNFRWNESPVAVLKNVTAMSAPVHVLSRELRADNMMMPALRLSAFELSSVSDAV